MPGVAPTGTKSGRETGTSAGADRTGVCPARPGLGDLTRPQLELLPECPAEVIGAGKASALGDPPDAAARGRSAGEIAKGALDSAAGDEPATPPSSAKSR